MATKTRAKDNSSLHKYRIELPVLIDDMELSVYARSLYIHLKRRAGDHGSCYEGARSLAKACGMSAGQVSKAKDELAARGLIVRNIKSVRGGIADDISIVDIWPETFEKYAPERDREKESDHHTITLTSKRSPHDHLDESDHHTITSTESDQEAITLTSKRSPHDPKNHDLPYNKDLDPPPPPLPPTPAGGGGGGESIEKEPTETSAYRWLRSVGVDSPEAARRNQHHDLAAMQAFYRRIVGDATHDEKKKRIGRFIRALDADGPPPIVALPDPRNGYAPPPKRANDAPPPAEQVARLAQLAKERR